MFTLRSLVVAMCVQESGTTYLVGMSRRLGGEKVFLQPHFSTLKMEAERNDGKFVGDYTVSHSKIKHSKFLSICEFK
jgi:hypothetical protein